MANIFAQYGTPSNWLCPDCNTLFVVYPGLPFDRDDHNCPHKARAKPRVVHCYWELMGTWPDQKVKRFVILDLFDPGLYVESIAPDGKTRQRWAHRTENGRDCYYPPDTYREGEYFQGWSGVSVIPGPHQVPVIVSRPMEEKLALGNRVSA